MKRLNGTLLIVLPLLCILAGILRLPNASAEVVDDCPFIVGTANCGDNCSSRRRVFAQTECSSSGTQGCCQYDAFNIRCDPEDSGATCTDKYFLKRTGIFPNTPCTAHDEGGRYCDN